MPEGDGGDPSKALHGLDAEQRAAVTAPAGPVCILAGAGTGKTRAITHRIAYRVLGGQVKPQHVLAVTFTARAAGEMRDRLRALGAGGVQARTFHAAALRQLRFFAPRLLGGRELPEVMSSKGRLVGLAAARARLHPDKTLGRDLAGEIEWAKASLVEPEAYPAAAARAGREIPVSPEDMVLVYQEYERLKRAAGTIDFEDLLRSAVWAIEEHPDVAEQVRSQYRHFVVDEYQDVNPVQQRLLAAWLGGRDDLTVVGDASQTIYSFTGASADHLIGFPRRYPGAVVVRLVRDYRSTPQVVGLANQVIARARGAQAKLRLELTGQRPAGPAPTVRAFPDEPAEAAAVATRCAELVAAGVPPREIAVLFRTNAQSAAYEEALADAAVPYTVQGAARFFERPEVRQAMVAIRSASRAVEPDTPLPTAVAEALAATGWAPDSPPAGGAQRERWEALAALVRLARDHTPAPREDDGGEPTAADALLDFHGELVRRAAAQHVPTVEGVTLASLHSAKGLEWDVVFLVGLVEGNLPVTFARTDEQVEEERRLLYVGITRAREQLWLSWPEARSPGGRPRRPSRFLPTPGRGATGTTGTPARSAEPAAPRRRRTTVLSCRVCGATLTAAADRKLGRCAECPSDIDEELYERLRTWRGRVAGEQKVPAYVVFTDATLAALAERRPDSAERLVEIPGIGARKLGLYGKSVLALIDGAKPDETPDVTTG
ncbi:ATP-dependent DNA helicase UvrD2 [Actinocatenispora rupis]|uniref:DNA 3'-5' helicase n=1 Tax=Actinocatenispora rupis TaxID=519421 RepID=A0A8J3J6X1_9ACTN|nr:ATP-dependent DNA helicase UvrD2 [Actinocatenispora rupis]GID15233.1 DNA helicase [Actinocatenispora rupis]